MRRVAVAAVAVAALLSGTSVAAADTAVGIDAENDCIYAGQNYVTTGGVATTTLCADTPDYSAVSPVAETRSTSGALNLPSALDLRLARATMAHHVLHDKRPAPNSDAVAAMIADMPDAAIGVTTVANIGGGIGANDAVPIYTVDSSHPDQHFVTIDVMDTSPNRRAEAMTEGRIPLPAWARPSDGDHVLSVYDVATGILRRYHGMVKRADSWTAQRAGYLYADASQHSLTERNYWLGYLSGSMSATELLSISATDVLAGRIDHMVAVSVPDVATEASFPASTGNGTLTDADAPRLGQMFTFAADFDVEAHIREHRIDSTTAAIMRAVDTHGGIVAHRSEWTHAFFFEHPYGMAEGNRWRDDAELSALVDDMDIDTFPWHATVWLPVHHAERNVVSVLGHRIN